MRDVRKRTFKSTKKSIAALKKWNKAHRNSGGEKRSTVSTRGYRLSALLLVGRGKIECCECKCDRQEVIEINHINGGGGKEHKAARNFYTLIATLRRPVDDLNLLCKVCNAVHSLETKLGKLPFKVTWNAK